MGAAMAADIVVSRELKSLEGTAASGRRPTSSFSAPLVARRMCYPSGMDETQKQDYFAQAERHIAIAEDRIARQKRIIDELAQAGQETDCAVSMLHALETCLHAFEQHRETIFERCKT
jgi:hypothetical protein